MLLCDIQIQKNIIHVNPPDAEDSREAPNAAVGAVADAAADAAPVAMEMDNEASSTSSASTSPRRRERRRKKKKVVEEKYVAPPGDDTVGRKWANDLPEIVLIQVRLSVLEVNFYGGRGSSEFFPCRSTVYLPCYPIHLSL